MKRENIHVGMRVKVKKSSPLTDAVGKYATVIGQPYDGYRGVYVHCLIDGDDDAWAFEGCNIKISDEEPVVGDRIVVIKGEPPYHHAGASGIIMAIHDEGVCVKFDRGDFKECYDNTWMVGDVAGTKYAIVRDVESVK